MRHHTLSMAALLALAGALSACEPRTDTRADAPDRDNSTVVAERRADPAADAAANANDAVRNAREAAAGAPDAATDKARDAATTAEVNARLVRDKDLSALRINVDTANGQVVLRGTAPDAAARDRATVLARGVDGVRGVDNQLQIGN